MQKQQNLKFLHQQHPFHRVIPSSWPLLTAFSILALTSNVIIYMHLWHDARLLKAYFSLIYLIFCISQWFYYNSDIITESTINTKY